MKIMVPCGASSNNRASVGQPSAAFWPPLRPSAAWGWVLSVGTGLPPQTPPARARRRLQWLSRNNSELIAKR